MSLTLPTGGGTCNWLEKRQFNFHPDKLIHCSLSWCYRGRVGLQLMHNLANCLFSTQRLKNWFLGHPGLCSVCSQNRDIWTGYTSLTIYTQVNVLVAETPCNRRESIVTPLNFALRLFGIFEAMKVKDQLLLLKNSHSQDLWPSRIYTSFCSCVPPEKHSRPKCVPC